MYITDIENYTGKDLIILTGPPGSRWSGVSRALSANVIVNTSDESDENVYDTNDKPDSPGWHRGTYWGPYHKHGKEFDNLNNLSKDEILQEFQKPFKNWEGIKVIKSHWFAYHLPYIRQIFPEARIIAVAGNVEETFKHWHTAGGWDITYPHYDWYKNNKILEEQITIELACIKEYFKDTKKRTTIDQVYEDLKLPNQMHNEDVLLQRDKRYSSLLTKYNSIKELFDIIVRNRPIFID